MPTWSTSNPPVRSGAYFNFVAAAQIAVQTGVTGVAAVIGTADWGPIGVPTPAGSQGEFEVNFSSSTGGTLRDGALGALDGFDLGGATSVLATRVAGVGAAAATLTLKDVPAAAAVTLTARYKGVRANNFSVTVQTNVDDATKRDLILYESGVELERYVKVTNTNDALVAAINAANSPYITAAVSGTSGRALASVVSGAAGTIFGTGTDTPGNSGTTLTAADIATAQSTLGNYDWNVAVLAGIDDTNAGNQAIQAAFASFIKTQNTDSNKRCFGVFGGAVGETLLSSATYPTTVSAQGRSAFLDNDNLINLTGDLKRLSDGAVIPSSVLAARFAGSIASIGLKRSMTYVTWTGYQVNTPLTPAQITSAIGAGVNVFANHSTTAVRLESALTTLVTTNTTDRPVSHKQIRNVAIDHFIQRQVELQMRDKYIAQLANTEQGRRDLADNILGFLQVLEGERVLQPSSSEVTLDQRFVQDGSTNAVYLQWAYAYANSIERIFSTIRVK